MIHYPPHGQVVVHLLHSVVDVCPISPVSFPNELFGLAALQHLNLGGNALTGLLPNLSGLRKLETIDVSYNSFSGPPLRDILESVRLLPLTKLDLSGNPELGNCKIPGPQLLGLPRVTHLNLSHMNLKGKLPYQLASLRNLEKLFLHSVHDAFLEGMFEQLLLLRFCLCVKNLIVGSRFLMQSLNELLRFLCSLSACTCL